MRSPVLLAATAFLITVATQAGAAANEGDRPGSDRQSAQPVDQVLTLQEAAALLRTDTAVVQQMAAAQRLPARRIGMEWRFSRKALLGWLAAAPVDSGGAAHAGTHERTHGNARSASQATLLSAVPLADRTAARIVGRGATVAGREAATPSEPDPRIGEAPEQRTASEVFLREQRLLLAPRELTWDIGAFYTRRDATVLTRVGDSTVLANAETDAYITQIIARYGLRRNTELWASASYSRQRASIYSGAQLLSRASRSEAGDIGLGLRQTLIEEGVGHPEVVASVEARIPTGDTSPALGAALSLVKSVDPVVLFGTLGYRHTFSRNFEDVSRLEPRNRIDLTLGYSFALNDTLSLNMALASSFARSSSFSNAELRSINASNLQLGMTARLAKGLYLQPTVSVRLSGPSRGYTLGLNIPITF